MLMRQVGSIGLSDADVLLQAAGQSASVPEPGVPRQLGATSVGAFNLGSFGSPLLWVGAGLGAALLLAKGTGGGGTVGKTKGMVVPLVVIGGIAAFWYFTRDKAAVAPAPTPVQTTLPTTPGTSVATQTGQTEGQSVRAGLIASYAQQPKIVRILDNADDETIRKWALIASLWMSGQDPYKIDTDGQPTTDYDNSVGKWYENMTVVYNLNG